MGIPSARLLLSPKGNAVLTDASCICVDLLLAKSKLRNAKGPTFKQVDSGNGTGMVSRLSIRYLCYKH